MYLYFRTWSYDYNSIIINKEEPLDMIMIQSLLGNEKPCRMMQGEDTNIAPSTIF